MNRPILIATLAAALVVACAGVPFLTGGACAMPSAKPAIDAAPRP